ncbi:MAG: hypothetical protein M0Z58_06775 [Nitrospiraceae bacterium]|nr:hypothetical protein [Nitrospiraceae bacterium]
MPLAVYNVSGEYAMIHAAAAAGGLDFAAVMQEALVSCKRAGAHMIISYFAKDAARGLHKASYPWRAADPLPAEEVDAPSLDGNGRGISPLNAEVCK